jgi:hypothetical protein
MTDVLVYPALALLLILGVAVFLRSDESPPVDADQDWLESTQGLWDNQGLSLAEKIFDPTDYLWLRDQAGFPRLAESLYRVRRRLALEWLRALRQSFDDLLRTPEPLVPIGWTGYGREAGRLLGQTLRFHLVLTYARLVVRFFGPYHRLVPAWRWVHPLTETRVREESISTTHLGGLP